MQSTINWKDFNEDEEIKSGDYAVAYHRLDKPEKIDVYICSYLNGEWVYDDTLEPIEHLNKEGVVVAYGNVPVYA